MVKSRTNMGPCGGIIKKELFTTEKIKTVLNTKRLENNYCNSSTM